MARSADHTVVAGWTEVTPGFLADQDLALAAGALKRFYDGQVPEWHHALAPELQIPRRAVATGAFTALRSPVEQTMVLYVGPDGEGKSTALLQIAVDLVGAGHQVLFRQPGTPLDIDALVELPAGGPWILASDDADEIAEDLHEAIKRVQAAGRRDIHWLLTARYEDWRARFRDGARTVEPAWASTVDLWPEVGGSPRVLGLTSDDAAKIIGAWDAAGCLGALAGVAPDARVDTLVEACQGDNGLSAATLLDGILGQRYGIDGLQEHVAAILPELGDDEHRLEGGRTLRDAFLYAAAGDVAGVDGVDLHVLADLLGIDREARGEILRRLGQAGLASGSAGALRARHHDLARAAVAVVEDGRLGIDLEQVFKDLVRGTGETGTDMKGLAAGGSLMNCGPVLAVKLRDVGLAPDRADQIARTAADESARVLPDLLMFALSRARTYRDTGEAGQAREILRAALAEAPQRGDWGVVGRRYLYDLSVSEGDAGRVMESILLAGLSISNIERLGQVSLTEAKLALDGMGAACAGMDAGEIGAPFQRLLRACTHLGRKVTPKWDQPARLNFHRYEVLAAEYGVGECSSAQAVTALSDAVAAARREVHDPELTGLWARLLPDPDRPPFGPLTKTLAFDLQLKPGDLKHIN